MFEAQRRAGVYAIRCIPSGKLYIGSSIDTDKRIRQHRADLRSGRHGNRYLQNAWNRHGEQAFAFFVLAYVSDTSKLIPSEQAYIDSFLVAHREYGFNARPVAESNLGMKSRLRGRRITAAHAANISRAKLGKPRPDVATWAPAAFRKFDAKTVADMRRDHAGGMTFRKLAEKYSCLLSTAHRVVRGSGVAYAVN